MKNNEIFDSFDSDDQVVIQPLVTENESKAKEVIFEIDGFKVYRDSEYIVGPKFDSLAPGSWQKHGKHSHPDAWKNFPCKFESDPNNPTNGVWDTGFFPSSPCYKNISSEEEKVALARERREKILLPYLKSIGRDNSDPTFQHAYGPYNHEDWNDFSIRFKEGTSFYTLNETNVFQLYLLLLHRYICPYGRDEDPKYEGVSHTIASKFDIEEKESNLVETEFEAIEIFMNLAKNKGEKEKLVMLLSEAGVVASMNDDLRVLQARFSEKKQTVPSFTRDFFEAHNRFNDPAEFERMQLKNRLRIAIQKNKVLKGTHGYMYENRLIGVDIENASRTLAKDPTFKDVKEEIMNLI